MLKEDVGTRFKAFRIDKKKAQHVLAGELNVHQSTITNIEHGTTFPKISYLFYFYAKYGLNINWLITGKGDMYLGGQKDGKQTEKIYLPQLDYGNPIYNQYAELAHLVQVPAIEQVLLAKLTECKILFKDEVKEFFDMKKQKEMEEAEASEMTETEERE